MSDNHILFSYSFDEQGLATKNNGNKASEELENDGLSWVHLDANDERAGMWLEKEVAYLDHLIIDALLAEETRPRIMEFGDGLLIIFRGVNLNKNAEPDDMVSIRMWIDDKRILTVQRRDLKALFDLKDQVDAGKKIKTSAEFLYNLLYHILSITSPYLYALNEKLDILEKEIMTTRDMRLREEIIEIRTQSAVFKRYLSPQKEVISKLRTSDRNWINSWAKRHFQENFDYITHMIEEVDEARDRSQILHDELANSLAEKLNKNMYKLSLITMVFMPLTFLTGLFGMNVGGIPGSTYQYAFYFCVSMMAIIAAIQVLFFKKRDLL